MRGVKHSSSLPDAVFWKIGLIWREILELARVSFLLKLPLLVSNPCDMLVKIYSEMQLNDGLQNEAYAFEVSFVRQDVVQGCITKRSICFRSEFCSPGCCSRMITKRSICFRSEFCSPGCCSRMITKRSICFRSEFCSPGCYSRMYHKTFRRA